MLYYGNTGGGVNLLCSFDTKKMNGYSSFPTSSLGMHTCKTKVKTNTAVNTPKRSVGARQLANLFQKARYPTCLDVEFFELFCYF